MCASGEEVVRKTEGGVLTTEGRCFSRKLVMQRLNVKRARLGWNTRKVVRATCYEFM